MASKFAMWMAVNNFSAMRADFYADLAEALEDKGSLVGTIRTFERRAAKRKDLLQPLYALWLRRMDDRPFSMALLGTVPDGDIMILDAAESSKAHNGMVEGLRFLSKAIVAAGKMKSELVKAVAGPIFLFCMLISMLVGFSYFMVPVLTQIMKPETWPMSGRALYWVAQMVTGYGVWIGAAIIILAIAYVWSLPRWYGRWRVVADQYNPLYSIYRDFVGSIFLVSFAALLRSNRGLSESLNALAARGSPWLRWHIRRIQLRLDKEADKPALAFDTGIFNRALTDRVMDYGARNEFHLAIGKIGMASIDKTTEFVSNSAKVLNQLLLVICGATMIFMVSGVLLTAQEAQNAIQLQTFSVR